MRPFVVNPRIRLPLVMIYEECRGSQQQCGWEKSRRAKPVVAPSHAFLNVLQILKGRLSVRREGGFTLFRDALGCFRFAFLVACSGGHVHAQPCRRWHQFGHDHGLCLGQLRGDGIPPHRFVEALGVAGAFGNVFEDRLFVRQQFFWGQAPVSIRRGIHPRGQQAGNLLGVSTGALLGLPKQLGQGKRAVTPGLLLRSQQVALGVEPGIVGFGSFDRTGDLLAQELVVFEHACRLFSQALKALADKVEVGGHEPQEHHQNQEG